MDPRQQVLSKVPPEAHLSPTTWKSPAPTCQERLGIFWVAVKEFNLSYHFLIYSK